MSIKDFTYYLDNKDNLSSSDYRSFNRYFLHPKDERLCSICKNIISDYKNNFNIKRYHKSKMLAAYDTRCKRCQSDENMERKLLYRNDPKIYIKSQIPSYRNRAKYQSVNFNLTSDYLYDLFISQQEKCFYTGESLSFKPTMKNRNCPHPSLASLDRKNPKLGYVEGNVVWCIYLINRMKNDCTLEEFIRYCTIISNNLQ